MIDKKKLQAVRLLIFTDKTKKEIAKELGITEQTLFNWLKDERFNALLSQESKIYYSYIRKKTFKKLNSLLLKAFDVLEQGLNSQDEKLKIKTAITILQSYIQLKDVLPFKSLNELEEIIEASQGLDFVEKELRDQNQAKQFLNEDLEQLLCED